MPVHKVCKCAGVQVRKYETCILANLHTCKLFILLHYFYIQPSTFEFADDSQTIAPPAPSTH